MKFNTFGFKFVFYLFHDLLPDADAKCTETSTSSISHKMQLLKTGLIQRLQRDGTISIILFLSRLDGSALS